MRSRSSASYFGSLSNKSEPRIFPIRLTSVGLSSIVLALLITGAAINTGTNLLYLMLATLLSLFFVSGFVGQQFALPEAVLTLRSVRRRNRSSKTRGDELIEIAATDPLNLVGVVTPGPRTPSRGDNMVVYKNGVSEEPARPLA